MGEFAKNTFTFKKFQQNTPKYSKQPPIIWKDYFTWFFRRIHHRPQPLREGPSSLAAPRLPWRTAPLCQARLPPVHLKPLCEECNGGGGPMCGGGGQLLIARGLTAALYRAGGRPLHCSPRRLLPTSGEHRHRKLLGSDDGDDGGGGRLAGLGWAGQSGQSM